MHRAQAAGPQVGVAHTEVRVAYPVPVATLLPEAFVVSMLSERLRGHTTMIKYTATKMSKAKGPEAKRRVAKTQKKMRRNKVTYMKPTKVRRIT